MKVAEWFDKNRFKASSFSNIKKLVQLKRKQKLTAVNSVRGIFLGSNLNRGLPAPTPGLLTKDRNG